MSYYRARQWSMIAAITAAAAAGHAQEHHGVPPIPDAAFLTGDARLACEAVLCLSTGTRPSECAPSIKRYFSITHRKLSMTLKARRSFLNLCPSSSQDDSMRTLVDAMANGAGRCDANSLNAALGSVHGLNQRVRTTSNVMPAHCTTFASHPYTQMSPYTARYVGVPERGGMWVEPEQYEKAQAAYTARVAAEDAAAQSSPDLDR